MNRFDVFDAVIDKYMPTMGEGNTIASQIATACNKLVYKWFNDGDIYDNTHYLDGWANDLSSYANWLYNKIDISRPILDRIEDAYYEEDYEELLFELCENLLAPDFVARYSTAPSLGSIYNEKGKFKVVFAEED